MSELITPSMLAERIHKKTGIDTDRAKKFSFAFFAIIKNHLKSHSSFIIHKFGTFKKIRVEQSIGRNPRTNEQIVIPAHWRIRFTPSRPLAQRLNAKYAHLKAKAINIPFFKNEDTKSFFPAEKTVIPEPERINESEIIDSGTNDEKTDDKKRTAILVGMGALLLAACLFLLIKLLGCSNSTESKTANSSDSSSSSGSTSENKEEAKAEETPQVPATEEVRRREFKVPAGSCYYKISEQEFNNRHAWPIIYAENSAENPDPDLINAYASIFIPVVSSLGENTEKYKESYITTYNAYYSVISSQPENPKNPLRQFRAVRVLVSGEIMYPGFIEEYKNQVKAQDYKDALAIFNNYVP